MRGLALSGGGFRATLFHLGVISYLYDSEYFSIKIAESERQINRALTSIEHITSVSGGSIMSAHLLHNWERYTNFGAPSEFLDAAGELIAFVQRDIRGRIVRRFPVNIPLYWLSIFSRRNLSLSNGGFLNRSRTSPSDMLEKYYSKYLFKDETLAGVAKIGRPSFDILATNMSDREGPACFTNAGLFTRGNFHAKESFPLARAVAASSAFPGMFTTVSFCPENEKEPIRLADGGIYDNLGVRRFFKLLDQKLEASEDIEGEILVSDAGVAYKQSKSLEYLEPITVPIAAADILYDRVYRSEIDFADHVNQKNKRDDQKKGWEFKFLTLKDPVIDTANPFRLSAEFVEHIKYCRTDLNHFSDLEVAALTRHGYSVAHETLKYLPADALQHRDKLPLYDHSEKTKTSEVTNLYEVGGKEAILVKSHLKSSSNRPWGLFSLRDSASVVTVLVLIPLLLGPLFLAGYTVDEAFQSKNAQANAQLAQTNANQAQANANQAQTNANSANIALQLRESRARTKVFVHISDESQRQYAEDLGDRLNVAGYSFQGVENLSRKRIVITQSDIRYRSGENRDEFAREILGVLTDFDISASSIKGNQFGNNFEIWISQEALPSLNPFKFGVILGNYTNLSSARVNLGSKLLDKKLGGGYVLERANDYHVVRLFSDEKDARDFIQVISNINASKPELRILEEWCSNDKWIKAGDWGYFNCLSDPHVN